MSKGNPNNLTPLSFPAPRRHRLLRGPVTDPGEPPPGVDLTVPWTFAETGTINWQGGNTNGTPQGAPPLAERFYTSAELVSGSVLHPRWVVSQDTFGLRFNFEDDQNCAFGQTEAFSFWNPHTQSGAARAQITITQASRRRMTITWSGMGESELPDFEFMEFRIKEASAPSYTIIGAAHAAGGDLKCEGGMVPVVSDPPPPQFVDLDLGVAYDIEIWTTTADPNYHNGAYYTFALDFSEPV